MENQNLIESSQWDAAWEFGGVPKPLRPWRNYVSWRFHKLFSSLIKRGDSVLEVGCGASRWLPYFAKNLGASVAGFDFAPTGVKNAIGALRRVGATGDIRRGDLFADAGGFPPDSFDVVWNGGFIEHFTDTADVIGRIARFAKRGGVVITETPNMGGLYGVVRRATDRELYNQHVHVTPALMDQAHACAGLSPVFPASYFGVFESTLFGIGRRFTPFWRRNTSIALGCFDVLAGVPFWVTGLKPESSTFSPLVVGVYRKV